MGAGPPRLYFFLGLCADTGASAWVGDDQVCEVASHIGVGGCGFGECNYIPDLV